MNRSIRQISVIGLLLTSGCWDFCEELHTTATWDPSEQVFDVELDIQSLQLDAEACNQGTERCVEEVRSVAHEIEAYLKEHGVDDPTVVLIADGGELDARAHVRIAEVSKLATEMGVHIEALGRPNRRVRRHLVVDPEGTLGAYQPSAKAQRRTVQSVATQEEQEIRTQETWVLRRRNRQVRWSMTATEDCVDVLEKWPELEPALRQRDLLE